MLKLNAALGRSADQNGSANGAADGGNSDGGNSDGGNSDGGNSGAASSDDGEVNANARDDAGGGASDAGGGANDSSSPITSEKEPKRPSKKTLETVPKLFTCAVYDEASNSWSCKRCAEVNAQCPLLSTGVKFDPFRVSARFKKHCETKVHTDALATIKVKAEGSLEATAEKIGLKRAQALLPSRKPHIRTAAALGQLGSAAAHFHDQLRVAEDSSKDLGATTPLDPTPNQPRRARRRRDHA